MAERGGSSLVTLAVFGVAVLVNLVLSVFLLDQVRLARQEVAGLKGELASKQDVAMLRPIRAVEILEERCEGCHTDRRFTKLAELSPDQVMTTIRRMSQHPGADIPPSEMRKIRAALLVFRCTACHSEAVLSQLVLMPREERVPFLRKKVAMPSSGFRVDQVGELIEAFETLVGAPQT